MNTTATVAVGQTTITMPSVALIAPGAARTHQVDDPDDDEPEPEQHRDRVGRVHGLEHHPRAEGQRQETADQDHPPIACRGRRGLFGRDFHPDDDVPFVVVRHAAPLSTAILSSASVATTTSAGDTRSQRTAPAVRRDCSRRAYRWASRSRSRWASGSSSCSAIRKSVVHHGTGSAPSGWGASRSASRRRARSARWSASVRGGASDRGQSCCFRTALISAA